MANTNTRAKIPSDLDAVPDEDGIVADSEQGYELVSIPTLPETETPRVEPPVTVYQNKRDVSLGEPTGNPPEWLIRTWTYAGKRQDYVALSNDWNSEYPDLATRLQDAVKVGWIDGESKPLPTPENPNATPDTHWIRLKPRTLEILRTTTKEKPGPKTNTRQVTVEGKQIDLRNRANFDLLKAAIQDVENVAHSYLHQFAQDPTKRQRRRLTCELQRVMTLRGQELSRSLYGSICLRLGMPLPPDFWTLPPEMLPIVGVGM